MPRSTARPAATLMLFSLFGAACQDLPTNDSNRYSPNGRGPSAARNAAMGEPYICYTSERVSGERYRYARVFVELPRGAEAADGTLQQYRYRMVDGDSVLAAANCRIPATEAAVRIMNARLQVGAGSRAEQPDDGSITTQGCVTDGTCILDGITVVGHRPPDYSGWGEGNGWEDGWGSSNMDTGGGADSDPGWEECDPSVDPDCYVPLTDGDKAAVQNSINTYTRKGSEFTDQVAMAECAALVAGFEKAYAEGRVFRGATETLPSDHGIEPHTGAYDPVTKFIHFDPSYLDRAATGDEASMRDLANTALHEAAHSLGYDHGASVMTMWGPLYSEQYFNRLSPGSNSCIK